MISRNLSFSKNIFPSFLVHILSPINYKGADKSLARPGRK